MFPTFLTSDVFNYETMFYRNGVSNIIQRSQKSHEKHVRKVSFPGLIENSDSNKEVIFPYHDSCFLSFETSISTLYDENETSNLVYISQVFHMVILKTGETHRIHITEPRI